MQFVDLSVPIEESPSEPTPPVIIRENHKSGSQAMQAIFNCTEDDLPQGLGWAIERLDIITHAGTHLDAPYHFFPTSEGKPARTIDQVPLEWCFADAFVLDMRHKEQGARIEIVDVEKALKQMAYPIKPFDIALIMTGADKFWGTPEYPNKGCGMGKDATLWLIERGIKIMGIDAWGFDRPFSQMIQAFSKTGAL